MCREIKLTGFIRHSHQRNLDVLVHDLQGEDQWFSLLDMPLEVPVPENNETIINVGPDEGETIVHRAIGAHDGVSPYLSNVESDLCGFIKFLMFLVCIMIIAFVIFALKEYL